MLDRLGTDAESIDEVIEEVRRRDAERLALQMTGDLTSGRDLLIVNNQDRFVKD